MRITCIPRSRYNSSWTSIQSMCSAPASCEPVLQPSTAELEANQYIVFMEMTARWLGITSRAKYAPRSKTWRSSSGIHGFQILLSAVYGNQSHVKNSCVTRLGPASRMLCG